jgi:4'-phosphopantetheinyl transferase
MNRTSLDIGLDGASLAVGEVHVWIADLDVAGIALGTLSPGERERAQRFARAQDARRWERSRGLLRLLLGEYLRADPAGLRFEAGERGKPRLAGAAGRLPKGQAGRLCFNMSHSAAVGLYAVALDVEVGVDVEMTRPGLDVLAVAERAFGGATAKRLERLDEQEREREFLRLWVRHEARLKCSGAGLGGGRGGARDRDCWTLDVEIDEDVAAAVVAAHEPARTECRRLKCAQRSSS